MYRSLFVILAFLVALSKAQGSVKEKVLIDDLRREFSNPPSGYGNVPFYWWNGDSLTLERLESQLQVLSESALSGLSVSYIHTHPKIDRELNAHGYGSFGRADGGKPEVFSNDWWKLWNSFARSCAEKGVGLGVDDYVLGWAGNGYYVDEITADPSFSQYQGRLKLLKIAANEKPKGLPSTIVSDTIIGQQRYIVYTEPSYLLHPKYGERLVDVYFNRFEQRMDSVGRKALNYFFQDELQYPLTIHSWSEDMPEEFLRRKDYDIRPYLYVLFRSPQSDREVKVRLDYAEVLTQLAEERYFRPVYEWHKQRGLIYGSDNTGRGLHPTQYLDYFRASSWYTAPGNDAPARGSSFMQTKVSSSVSHLYQRPRTWLEAFHSMGWGSNGQWLTRQLDHHLMAGGNLLCMHGLYYSTHGTWWEWAPPCFHFRMPYWTHMKLWLKRAERLCYLLSQGHHVCDVAILYPTETMQAYPDTRLDKLWQLCDSLSLHGIDFDFVDYQSLQQATVCSNKLCIGDEQYQMLLTPIARALHPETEDKIREFGRNNVKTPDFKTSSGRGRVLHRRIIDGDIYMIMDVKPGDSMFFRAKGRVECWNPWDGTSAMLPVDSVTQEGTWIRYTGDEEKSQIIVFTPGEPIISKSLSQETVYQTIIPIEGEWLTEMLPTMDNRWGDFCLPASDEIIGVEAREVNGELIGFAPYMETCNDDGNWRPYVYSWQYGVKDAPGSQGYHGLKGKIDDRFIILDQGGTQLFRTSFYANKKDTYQMVVEGKTPDSILVDGKIQTQLSLQLKKGWHKLLLIYKDTQKTEWSLTKASGGDYRDPRERSAVMFYHAADSLPKHHTPNDSIVAMRWYGTQFLPYDPTENESPVYLRIPTAPGAKRLHYKVAGQKTYTTKDLPQPLLRGGEVTIKVKPARGCPSTAALAAPVKIDCGEGRMKAGNWSDYGALKYYSGGIRYTKHITIDNKTATALLDLGEVDATCEVSVNGSAPQVLIDPPYRLDITPLVHQGDNTISVLVYSSLSNHYQTTPSPYRGNPHAGLIGPMSLIITQNKHK